MITAEPVVYIIRSGDEHKRHGDPYTFSATMVVNDSVATIIGATGILPSRGVVAKKLKSLGVRSVQWDRITDGVPAHSKVIVK